MRLNSNRVRVCLLASISATVFFSPAAAQDAPPKAPNCSVVCTRDIAREVTHELSAIQERQIRERVADAAANTTSLQLFEGVLSKYRAESQRIASDLGFVKNSQRISEVAWAIKDDVPLSDAIPTNTLSTLHGQTFDSMIDRLEERGAGLGAKVLSGIFDELRSTQGQNLEKMKDRPWSEVHTALYGPDGNGGLFANSTTFQSLPADARAEIALLRSNLVYDQLGALSGRAVRTEAQINALVADYAQFRTQMETFAAETATRIDRLTEGQRALTEAHFQLKDWVAGNTYRIDRLEGIMFGQLSAKEQADALRSGDFSAVLGDRSPQERAEFLAKLDRAATLETISSTAGAVNEVANSFKAIGQLVGVDLSEPVALINKGATIAQGLVGIASGNPLAVINGLGGIAGVFGGGGDGTSKALAALRRDVQQMRREMHEYHLREMEALGQLSAQIDQRFTELAALQTSTLSQVGFNSRQIDNLLREQLNSCILLVDQWRLTDHETHDDRARNINENYTSLFTSCRDGIRKRFTSDPVGTNAVSTIFSARALNTSGTEPSEAARINLVTTYIDETLVPTISYVFANHPFARGQTYCNSVDLVFSAALRGPKRDGDLRVVAKELEQRCATGPTLLYRFGNAQSYDIRSNMVTPIAITNVLTYGRAVFEAMAVWEFMDQPGGSNPRVATRQQLLTRSRTTTRALAAADQLQAVLDVVNLSLAQINLLSGDLVLEVLATDIERGLDSETQRNMAEVPIDHWTNCDASSGEAARYFNAVCVIHRNDILRENFMRHWVRTRLSDPIYAKTIYAVGLKTPSQAATLQSAFRRTMPIAKCGEAWCFNLPTSAIVDPKPSPAGGDLAARFNLSKELILSLPQWGNVATDRQIVAPDIDALLQLRQDLMQRIAEFRMSRDLTDAERELVYVTLLVDQRRAPK